MRIPLDRQSTVPLYQQIENFIREAIISGGLEPEARLPATRKLASDLGVNRITVETAYAGLEADGLIYTKVGSGTYILPPYPLPPETKDDNEPSWPGWQRNLTPDADIKIRTLVGRNLIPAGEFDLIDFTAGLGAPDLFPVEAFRKVIQMVMRRDGIEALGYGERQGYAPLRSTIAHVLASQGLPARPDNVLITAGSQQAIALVAQRLLKPGDTVLVEKPTYTGALDLLNHLGFQIVDIPVDEHGMQVEKLEPVLQQYCPKLIYSIPTFQNPTGACLSGQRRRQLVALAQHYDVPILEDDFVGDLRYDGRAQPTLKALDPGGIVIYISTFSKMLMPGLRVGFLVAEGPVFEALVDFKSMTDLATSNLIQRGLEAFVTVGRYQAHLRRACQVYRRRRDVMAAAIERFLPAEVQLSVPQGGLFIWLQLPEGVSAARLLGIAKEERVAFSLGSDYFQVRAEGDSYLRLNFCSHTPERIEEGILRLRKALELC
jgi:GntR family transcriptional regulator/MocR family aminotransferase